MGKRIWHWTVCFALTPAIASAALAPTVAHKALAREILADRELPVVLEKARTLVGTGLNAGSGYGEVWIRDLNTFIELALEKSSPETLRNALLTFLKFQGTTGDIVDGFIPKERASVGYRYRKTALAPELLAHKNTVETDQESSLVQAIRKYVTATGDRSILEEQIDGMTVIDRLGQALNYLLNERFDPGHGLIWGATTADWGDVQPEHSWGVELDESSHRAIDIYDNAMMAIALRDYGILLGDQNPESRRWSRERDRLSDAVRRHLWDSKKQKYIPHLYLNGSPFPAGLDEGAIDYHGGTAVAIEAGFLTPDEIKAVLERMRANVRAAGASSIGLTVYPPYPEGSFKNRGMGPYSYQNGGDWCWFGGRMIQQLIRNGFVQEAFRELKPMISRVVQHGDFYEWWSLDNQPRGSARFRGSAGVLGRAIEMLLDWAHEIEQGGSDAKTKVPTAYWPSFRGPNRSGVSESDFPIHFGPESNVVWKVTIPGGRSSPCIWGNRLFLTAFADGKLLTICADTDNGRELWRQALSPGAIERGARLGSPATATPVTDGKLVFVYFGAFGLAAYDYDGRTVWTKPLPIPVTQHGAGTSPVIAGDALILNCDQDVGSYLLALHKDNGDLIWKCDRSQFRRGFSTPLPYPFDHPSQIIVAGTLRLTSYNLTDGSERWTVRGLPNELVSSPIAGDGMIFVAGWTSGSGVSHMPTFEVLLAQEDTNGDGKLTRTETLSGPARQHFLYIDADKDGFVNRNEYDTLARIFNESKNALLAVRPDGEHDVTESHVVWQTNRGLPYAPTPLLYQGRLYLLKNGGLASCYEAKTGKALYREERVGALGDYYASPIAANGKICVVSQSGTAVIFRAGDTLDILARNPLGETVVGTPAVAGGRLFVRTETQLYAFGERVANPSRRDEVVRVRKTDSANILRAASRDIAPP